MHRRFFVNFPVKEKEPVVFKEKKLLHQLKNVLRIKRGEKIILLDNKGGEYEIEIIRVFDSQISGLVRKKIESAPAQNSHLGLKINLYQALLIRGQRLKFVFEKGTELGVNAFIPIRSRYSLKKNADYERMRRIIKEAAEQSARREMPEIKPVIVFSQAVKEAAEQKDVLNIVFYEKGNQLSLETLPKLKNFKNYNIFIGPEGGFSEEEIGLAKKNNFLNLKIGNLTLRSETAAVAALAIIQSLLPR